MSYVILIVSLLLSNVFVQQVVTLPAHQHEMFVVKPDVSVDITPNYKNTMASFMWANLVSYIGGKNNHNIDYVAQSLDTITTLNPLFEPPYYMAATYLAWGDSNTSRSDRILDKAITAMPNTWRWYYYRGFNAYWFNNNKQKAAYYLRQSAIKGAPDIITDIALKMSVASNDIDVALYFLNNELQHISDKKTYQRIEYRVVQIETEKQLRKFDKYIAKNGLSIDAAVKRYKNVVLPDGGRVIEKSGRIVSSKTKKRYTIGISRHFRSMHENHD